MVAITTAGASRVAAHVAPSVDDNNRYLKVTPFGDRVRIAYTVFFGEVPGAIERRTIDRNRDGQISDAEGHAFGQKIADEVRAALELEVDGHTSPPTWTTVDVGMGTPQVAAGSFSVDLVAYGCFATARGKHHIGIRDRFRLTHPGETEVNVEDGLGITIDRARVGPADDPTHDYKFAGPGGPLSDDGLDLQITAGPKSTVTADATCAAEPRSARRTWPFFAGGGVLLAGLGAWLAARLRARARPR
ncbi:MAG: hypothetical protein ABI591_07250 [Kofleriaceae bacterium]